MKNINKIITLLLLTLGSSSVINAQTTTKTTTSETKIGVKGGLNMSNLYTNEVEDENVLTGFNVGLFIEMPLTSTISLQPEFLYTTKGSEQKYNNAITQGTAKFRLNYIEVPLMVKAKLTNNFNLQFGPYAAYLIDSKVTNENNNGTFNFESNINEDDLNRLDFGLAAGFGIDFSGFGIGARYNYGLTPIGKERTIGGQTYTFPEGKNSVLSVFATINF